MSQTKTADQLFVVAVQDLCDAEHAWIERIPCLAGKASGDLVAYLEAERGRAAGQAARLEEIADRLGARATEAPNIWLRANLDDAERDAETIARGVLRDIALTGAFRKAKQSERVSYETAVGLAGALGFTEYAVLLKTCRDEEAVADDELAWILKALLQGLV